jgi:hypothetical protein
VGLSRSPIGTQTARIRTKKNEQLLQRGRGFALIGGVVRGVALRHLEAGPLMTELRSDRPGVHALAPQMAGDGVAK